MQTICWCEDHIRILDQTRLPAEEVYIECRDLETMADAIRRLAVRGAPAIGIAAAMGLAFEAQKIARRGTAEISPGAAACLRVSAQDASDGCKPAVGT